MILFFIYFSPFLFHYLLSIPLYIERLQQSSRPKAAQAFSGCVGSAAIFTNHSVQVGMQPVPVDFRPWAINDTAGSPC